jgi:GNAT superfamily N-acetyltransferase
VSGGGVRFPEEFHIEILRRDQPRRRFRSGNGQVDDWLAARALRHQEKHLSVTRGLLDGMGMVAGYYTLATGQVDISDLPPEVVRRLPRRQLPVAVIAWLGVEKGLQGRGLGRLLLAQALRDCYDAGRTFAFIAVVLDCIDDAARSFYQQFGFQELPGHPYRLFLSARHLEAMMEGRSLGRPITRSRYIPAARSAPSGLNQ